MKAIDAAHNAMEVHAATNKEGLPHDGVASVCCRNGFFYYRPDCSKGKLEKPQNQKQFNDVFSGKTNTSLVAIVSNQVGYNTDTSG